MSGWTSFGLFPIERCCVRVRKYGLSKLQTHFHINNDFLWADPMRMWRMEVFSCWMEKSNRLKFIRKFEFKGCPWKVYWEMSSYSSTQYEIDLLGLRHTHKQFHSFFITSHAVPSALLLNLIFSNVVNCEILLTTTCQQHQYNIKAAKTW